MAEKTESKKVYVFNSGSYANAQFDALKGEHLKKGDELQLTDAELKKLPPRLAAKLVPKSEFVKVQKGEGGPLK